MTRNSHPREQRFLAPAKLLGVAPDARRALIVAATEDLVGHADEWTRWEMTAAACDLSHLLSGKAPLLDSHLPTIADIIGVIEHAWIEPLDDGRAELHCIARFSRNPRGEAAWRDAHDGILNFASVGSGITKAENVNGIVTARRWRPFEVSLCSQPRDLGCSIVRTDAELRDLSARLQARHEVYRDLAVRCGIRAARWEEWALGAGGEAIAEALQADPDRTRAALRSSVDRHVASIIQDAAEGR